MGEGEGTITLTLKPFVAAISVALTLAVSAAAPEPPDREQIERYRLDGSFARRVAAARQLGNHRVADRLLHRLGARPGVEAERRGRMAKNLPTTGTGNVFALLIAFSDFEPSNDAPSIDDRLFGDGPGDEFPCESLRDFYQRHYQVAVGLGDGRVLVAGGYSARTAEIFDPATETWSPTEPLNSFHLGGTATADSSGRVVLFGGFDRRWAVVDTVEIFDPDEDSWVLVAPMSQARYGHQVSGLPDGSMMITGGISSIANWPYPGSTEAEVFGPPTVFASPRHPSRRVIPSGR